jgi:adenylate cyclase
LADGLTNGIITALVTAPGLAVIHDESPSMAKSKWMTVQELARRFDARYVVKGRVHKLGDRFRVNAELMEVVTGRCLWAEQFDRNLRDAGDLFAIQDEVTEAIVTALHVKLLTGEAGRLVRRAFKDPAALDSIYRGEELLWNASTKLELRGGAASVRGSDAAGTGA